MSGLKSEISDLNSASFAGCLHTHFSMENPANENVALELVEVNEANYSPRLENFSLLFRGPLEPVFPQCIYRLNHATLGAIELFLVPLGPDGEGMRYEAVFNRFRADPQ